MSAAPQIVVIGSLNMDLVARAPRLPARGETVSGTQFATVPGGKGANQAVAAARLGARTAMVGCVGDDAFGAQLRNGLLADGIDGAALRTASACASGVALIVVDAQGQNMIVVVPGANGLLAPADIDAAEPLIAAASMVVMQLETPLETALHAARRARALGKTVVLNPAPARALPASLLGFVDYLIPNEVEAAALTGVVVESPQDAMRAGQQLLATGVKTVLVTLGDQGVVTVDAQGQAHAPARPVDVVDTTAAGDTFIGGFCAALLRGDSVPRAVAFGQAAAAICVTRPGAQPSIPFAREMPLPG
jgi:ribokinase